MLLTATALLVVVFLAASFWLSFAQKRKVMALILKVVSGLGLTVIVFYVWVKILTHVFR